MIKRDRLVDTFLDYVRIDSESRKEGKFAQRLLRDLEELGIRTWVDRVGEIIDSDSGNIYAFIEGDPKLEPILFTAHMDTVVPGIGIEPYIDGDVIKSKGDTILGSDDKSGIAALMEALRVIKEQKLTCRPVELLFTICEEIGLMGSDRADLSRFKARYSVAVDGCGAMNEIVTRGSGQIRIEVDIIGKAVHAGACPEKGVSAIRVAAEAISNMKLFRIDHETTANIGMLSSENPTNIVSDHVHFLAEARSGSPEKLMLQGEHMRECLQNACDKYGAQFTCEINPSYPSYCVPENEWIVEKLKEKYKQIGIETKTTFTSVGSDSNILNCQGICSVVIPTGMTNPHALDEQIRIEDLVTTAQLLLNTMLK